MRRLRCSLLPYLLDEFRALLAQDSLYAPDGVALAVKQVANSTQKVDVVRPVIAAPTAALHRFDLVKPAFPKPQDVLRQVEVFGHLADGAKCVRRLAVQSGVTP